MAYQRKTKDTWEVQANYGYGDGWECVGGGETRREALADLKDYRANAPEYPYRLKKVREKIEQPQVTA